MRATLDRTASELVNRLRARGVSLRINGSKVRAAPRTALTAADRAAIRECQPALFELVTAIESSRGVHRSEPPEPPKAPSDGFGGSCQSTFVKSQATVIPASGADATAVESHDAPQTADDWFCRTTPAPGATGDAARIDWVHFPLFSKPEPRPETDWSARWHREWAPWVADNTELIDWFQSHCDRLPSKPFALFPWASVCDAVKFFRALEGDIRSGSNGPRAAGLIHDLRRLRELF